MQFQADRSVKTLIVMCLCVAIAVVPVVPAHAWGDTGHRAVGRIAEQHLTPAAARAVREILGRETLAAVSTYADEIRSDPDFRHTSPWHYVTIEDGETYESSRRNPAGDIIEAIRRFTATLRSQESTHSDKVFALKWLVHLVGDIHQPLHVGRGPDRGGNTIMVDWFGEKSTLHSVWDSGMIDSTKLSFSELAEFIDVEDEKTVTRWQSSDVLNWAAESIRLREDAYSEPGDGKNDSYTYRYKNLPIVKRRLAQAGIRLAGLLNSVFDGQ